MKLSTIIGFILGFTIIGIVIFSKEDVHFYLSIPSLAITLGGTIAAVLIYFSPGALKYGLSAVVRIFTDRQQDPRDVLDLLVDINKRSRKTTYSTILKSVAVRKIPYLVKALTFLADGVERKQIEDILHRENRSRTEKDRIAERVFSIAGSFAPMFGMMGTVIGLIAMLNRVENPDEIPAAMGLALVTTLYGLVFSALIFKPLAGKIRDKNNIDTNVRDIIIEGVLSIQEGENAQITKEKLLGYVK